MAHYQVTRVESRHIPNGYLTRFSNPNYSIRCTGSQRAQYRKLPISNLVRINRPIAVRSPAHEQSSNRFARLQYCHTLPTNRNRRTDYLDRCVLHPVEHNGAVLTVRSSNRSKGASDKSRPRVRILMLAGSIRFAERTEVQLVSIRNKNSLSAHHRGPGHDKKGSS